MVRSSSTHLSDLTAGVRTALRASVWVDESLLAGSSQIVGTSSKSTVTTTKDSVPSSPVRDLLTRKRGRCFSLL